MKESEKEALEILKVIDKYFPKMFDAKNSILWLHEYSSNKKQDEWASFFFEDFCFSILTKIIGGWKGPWITTSQRFDYQRKYVWDFKMHSNRDTNNVKKSWAPLNDIQKTDKVIEENKGIGYIIAKTDFEYDKSGSIKKWRNRLENRTTGGHMLKKSGNISEIFAVFLEHIDDVRQATKEGWIKEFKQGKNADKISDRKPKYQLDVEKIPKKRIIKLN